MWSMHSESGTERAAWWQRIAIFLLLGANFVVLVRLGAASGIEFGSGIHVISFGAIIAMIWGTLRARTVPAIADAVRGEPDVE